MHKVLMHGADVKNMLLLPIGIYSEQTQEAQNNHSRQYRLKHARKTSRLDTITDQLKYLLVTSDPLITNIIAKDLHRRRLGLGRHHPADEHNAAPQRRRSDD